ncbi:hypothetical protein [Allosphingosinicella vermicomposti]|uniref:hypothetical protein n=1 Tax=Allosphingosinicella vermicomposti TaxID=614671 RepID=UPI00131A59EC|nr:hypothetical protein [Allosphingosinicella vermicomposti]
MKIGTMLLAGAALLSTAGSAAETEYSRFRAETSKKAERRGEAATALVNFWSGKPAAPAATLVSPTRYPIGKILFGDPLKEAERAAVEKRAKTVVDSILAMPSLRGAGISIRLAPEVTRLGFEPGAILDFTVKVGTSEAPFRVELGKIDAKAYNEEDVGPTPGGCARWQGFWPGPRYSKTGVEGVEVVVKRLDKGFSPIKGIRILLKFQPDLGDANAKFDPLSAQGRAAAAIYGLSCDQLLKAANGLKDENADF